jgi:hypothetical protein
MIEVAHIAKSGGKFSARDFACASIVIAPSIGLPLAQLLLLSCP